MKTVSRRYHADAEADNPAPPVEKSAPQEQDRKSPASGVRYGAMNWIGEFRNPPNLPAEACGSKVVIQTDRGIELGQRISLLCHGYPLRIPPEQVRLYVENSGNEFYRFGAGRILRAASPQDVNEHDRLNLHKRSDVELCSRFAAELELKMKVVTAEHLLGGERIVFYFRADGRVDFRELVRRLAQHYQTRIEMRQVGARDEARLIADYEICGRECCCKNFLKKLRPVTMRMAKLQKSTLDPTKVSGRCGRLRCCLRYEHEVYDELCRRLPRIGAIVQTEFGPATVLDRQILTQLLLVKGDNDQTVAVPFEEVKLIDPRGDDPDAESSRSELEEEVDADSFLSAGANAESGRPGGDSSGHRRRRSPGNGPGRRPGNPPPSPQNGPSDGGTPRGPQPDSGNGDRPENSDRSPGGRGRRRRRRS